MTVLWNIIFWLLYSIRTGGLPRNASKRLRDCQSFLRVWMSLPRYAEPNAVSNAIGQLPAARSRVRLIKTLPLRFALALGSRR